ncbi:MAG: hypothetical protein MUC92_08670 [Fimbriimonadaceae bacterium]|jgi:hypothetical protein|nr:hypothetical protein [Fimbriimonadaceae bacterium]
MKIISRTLVPFALFAVAAVALANVAASEWKRQYLGETKLSLTMPVVLEETEAPEPEEGELVTTKAWSAGGETTFFGGLVMTHKNETKFDDAFYKDFVTGLEKELSGDGELKMKREDAKGFKVDGKTFRQTNFTVSLEVDDSGKTTDFVFNVVMVDEGKDLIVLTIGAEKENKEAQAEVKRAIDSIRFVSGLK